MKHQNKLNQNGMVAIIVCMLLMAIITLITVGFARIMQREYRQSLDRQLSSQAFYAAESAVNDAKKLLPTLSGSLNTCSNASKGTYNIDTGNGITVTCLTIDTKPPTLEYGNISTDQATIAQVQADSSQVLDSISITWSDTENGNPTAAPAISSPMSWPDIPGWGAATGVLRVDLMPIDSASLQNRTSIRGAVRSYFLYPGGGVANNTGGSIDFVSGADGEVVNGQCNKTGRGTDERACRVNITGLGNKTYYMKMRAIYQNVAVSISGKNASAQRINFVNSQALIDSTAKAQDVVRRVVTQVPINYGIVPSDFGFISSPSDICKDLTLSPTESRDNCSYNTAPHSDPEIDAVFTVIKDPIVPNQYIVTNASNNTAGGLSCTWQVIADNVPVLPAPSCNPALGTPITLLAVNLAGKKDIKVTLTMSSGGDSKSFTKQFKN